MSARRRDRWYSIEGQRRIHRSAMESSKGPRQLIYLVVLLVLTLIAMRQVSDPKRVGRVATAVGLLPASGSLARSTTPDARSSARPQGNLAIGIDDPQTIAWSLASFDRTIELRAEMLERLLGNASPGMIAKWAEQELIAPDSNPPASEPLGERERSDRREWLSGAIEMLTRWTELADSMSSEHAALASLHAILQASRNEIEQKPADPDAIPDPASALALRLALERALVAQFADNTPWNTGDRMPLIRTTQRAVLLGEAIREERLASEMFPAVAVPQLMGDIDAFRGRPVRVAGRIMVDQPASLAIEDERINAYRVLWLRPDDGSNQPLIVHVPSSLGVPPDRMQIDRTIVVSGIVAKRRAYASQRGADIAPVLVAADIQSATESPHAEPKPLTETQQSLAALWRQGGSAVAWRPPLDIAGALQRIQQRVGARAEPLQSLIEKSSMHDPLAIIDVARNPIVLATLAGLHQVQRDVELAAQIQMPAGDARASRVQTRSGTVVKIDRIAIVEDPFPGWEWKELYACTLATSGAAVGAEPADDASTCIVLTQQVPAAWLGPSPLRQPAVASGWMCDTASVHPLMISPSVDWRQTNSTSSPAQAWSPPLPLAWQTLLDRGWNLSWIDMIEGLQGQGMSSRESQAFYRLLRCTAEPLESRAQEAGPSLSIMEAIQRAENRKSDRASLAPEASSTGHRANAIVQIRRVQRVDVRNPDEQSWLGSDHYYQLDGLADIGNNRISIRYEGAAQPLVFEKEFPITLVATRVPDGLLTDAADAMPGESQAWYPRARLEVSGWFYRMWRFKTTQVSEATGNREAQQGPMLAVDRFSEAPAPAIQRASRASPAWVTALTLLIGGAGGLWILRMIRQGLRPRSSKG